MDYGEVEGRGPYSWVLSVSFEEIVGVYIRVNQRSFLVVKVGDGPDITWAGEVSLLGRDCSDVAGGGWFEDKRGERKDQVMWVGSVVEGVEGWLRRVCGGEMGDAWVERLAVEGCYE